MKLVFPSIAYKEKAIEFINEFNEYNSDINGSGALDGYLENSTYEFDGTQYNVTGQFSSVVGNIDVHPAFIYLNENKEEILVILDNIVTTIQYPAHE